MEDNFFSDKERQRYNENVIEIEKMFNQAKLENQKNEMRKVFEEREKIDKAIREIESLYPPNSVFRETRMKAKELLLEAICAEWRHLPEEIIFKFRDLCVDKEKGWG